MLAVSRKLQKTDNYRLKCLAQEVYLAIHKLLQKRNQVLWIFVVTRKIECIVETIYYFLLKTHFHGWMGHEKSFYGIHSLADIIHNNQFFPNDYTRTDKNGLGSILV